MIQKVRDILTAVCPDKSDLFLCAGAGSLFYGVHRIHPPSAFIALSLVSFVVAAAQSRREVR